MGFPVRVIFGFSPSMAENTYWPTIPGTLCRLHEKLHTIMLMKFARENFFHYATSYSSSSSFLASRIKVFFLFLLKTVTHFDNKATILQKHLQTNNIFKRYNCSFNGRSKYSLIGKNLNFFSIFFVL